MKKILLTLFLSLTVFTSDIYALPSTAAPEQALSLNSPTQISAQPMITTSPSFTTAEMSNVEKILANTYHPLIIVLVFLGFGCLLAFTPCVLPMIPILSSIIIGHHKQQRGTKTFSLSLAYVAGMAIAYAMAGMVAALIGSRIQMALQQSWTLVLFSGIFVLLALPLLGLYQFQLPSQWQQRLTALSHRQKGGTYIGVFIMGGISSLIVSPCISPVLVGVLTYIAHTGNLWLGGLALLSLGIGMGLPLLLVGASLEKYLPQAGAWMQTIERLAGIMMLGVAIWLLARIIPGPVTLFLWSVLFITSAITLGDFAKTIYRWQPLRHSLAALLLMYGLILLIGASLGNSDPLHPWENVRFSSHPALQKTETTFIVLKNMQELDQALLQAKQEKKWVIVDFYAAWCQSCLYMERYVFSDPRVKQTLAPFVLLRDDLTANTDFDAALLERFNIAGIPTLLFFPPLGNELTAKRVIGTINASDLIARISEITRTY